MRGKVWAGQVRLLFRCSLRGQSDGHDPAFEQYLEFVASLNEIDETLKFLELQWATSGSRGKKVMNGESKDRKLAEAAQWSGATPF